METVRRVMFGLLFLAAAAATGGCRSTSEGTRVDRAAYRTALAQTESATLALERGSELEQAAIRQFVDFYRVYSEEVIKLGVRDLYAADAYFGDPFKSVSGVDAIETYFLRMAEPVESCTFDVSDLDVAGGEYYFRWTMHLVVERAPDKPLEALGLSHVRFNKAGKVVFQQDYWDTSVLLERLPVVGGMVRYVKSRLEE